MGFFCDFDYERKRKENVTNRSNDKRLWVCGRYVLGKEFKEVTGFDGITDIKFKKDQTLLII